MSSLNFDELKNQIENKEVNASPNMELEIRDDMQSSKKNERKKMIKTLVATSVASSIAGGLIVGAVGLYVLPKTDIFKNSELYKSIASQNKFDNYSSAASILVSSESVDLSIPQIAKKVGPAVVGISTRSVPYSGGEFPLYKGEVEGMGSGIVFNKEGYIVTNYHVVQGAQEIKVIFNNGKQAKAKVVNYDQNLDLAVIKLTEKVEVPAVAEFGDSDKVEVGELAVAIGNPLGKDLLGSVTAGVISALNRQININNRNLTFIQTDAAINPGNSGGALVNSKGQVIGINTAKIGANGVEGIGFAIPINTVKAKIDELSKPLLKIGIMIREIDSSLSKQYRLPEGIYVLRVEEFSAAERAGIEAGDVIIKFGGERVKTYNDLNRIKSKYKAGDTIKVEVVRDGKSKILDLKLIEN
jgi:serine protease Do